MIEKEINKINLQGTRDYLEVSYSDLYGGSLNSTLILELNGDIKYLNKAAEELIRYNQDCLIGENFFDLSLIPAQYKENIKKFLDSLVYGEISKYPHECKIISHDGNNIQVDMMAILIKPDDHLLIQVILFKHKDYDVAPKLSLDTISFKELADSLPDIVFEADLDLKLTYLNKCGYNTFNINQQDLIDGIRVIDLIKSEDKKKAIISISRILSGEKTTQIELSLDKKNGKPFYSKIHLSSIYRDAILVGIRGIMYDITHRKLREKLIKKENRRLRNLDAFRKEFLDLAAHEFKTPLTSIYGAIQILLDYYHSLRLDSSLEVFELLEIIKNGSAKLKGLILNLLDFSKYEAGKIQLNKQNINLVALINNCIRDLKYLIYQKEHEIEFNHPEKIISYMDHSKLERVFTNLISNAIKYTPSQGKIEINMEQNNNEVIVKIQDNGIGLSKEDLKGLFKRFNQFNKGMQDTSEVAIEGTGLGLFISKEIIELHEGSIWAESKGKNKGSTFFVKIPLIKN